MKSKFIAYVAVSADGYIATNDKTKPDWTSEEDWEFLQSSLKKADASIMGRTTFELISKTSSRKNRYVFSRSVKHPIEGDGAIFINPKYTDIRELMKNHQTIAVLGGSEVYSYMIKNSYIDELYITIEPVILGNGVRFIDANLRVRLVLLSIKRLNNHGTVLFQYKVK